MTTQQWAKKLGLKLPEGHAGFIVAFLPDDGRVAVTFVDKASHAALALQHSLSTE